MWLTEPEVIKRVLLETPLEFVMEDTVEDAERGAAVQSTHVSLQEALHTMPVVSIGQPEIWSLLELYPSKQMPRPLKAKLAKADFYLVRLSCSFRPIHQESRVEWARFRVTLHPDSSGQSPIANDLYPLEVNQEVKHKIKVSLNPTLKFQELEMSGGDAEFGLEYRELQPRISASGAGQSDPSWDYQEARGIIIQGSKWMYLLVKAPKGMSGGRATLDLIAHVKLRGWQLPVVAKRKQEPEAQLAVQLW